jgi:hypothetical protein
LLSGNYGGLSQSSQHLKANGMSLTTVVRRSHSSSQPENFTSMPVSNKVQGVVSMSLTGLALCVTGSITNHRKKILGKGTAIALDWGMESLFV